MDRHNRDSGIAPEIKPELPEEEEEIVLSSDSEHSAEDQVIPGGDALPGGVNVEVPDLQPIPDNNQEEQPDLQPIPDNIQEEQQPPPQNNPEPVNPEANPNQADNMAAQGVQGSQISSIPVFSGIAGLDGAAYAEAIDQA